MLRFWTALATMLVCGSVATARAEILDRMAAVVNGKIITLSDIQQERQVRAVLSEGAGTDSVVLQELIEKSLMEEQMVQYPDIDASEKELEDNLGRIQNSQGIPLNALRDAVVWRLRQQKYFDLRFRQFIRPTDQELQNYYQAVFLPEAQRRGLNPIPSFEQIADSVRSNVIHEKTIREVEDWLATIRRRSAIETFP